MNFLKILKIILIYFLSSIFGVIIPKDKRIVVLSGNRGLAFAGNSKALYLYLSKDKKYKAYYYIRDREKYLSLKQQGVRAKYHYSFSGLLTFLRARTVCITHGFIDFLGFTPSPWQKWIDLSHGGSKLFGFLDDPVSFKTKFWHLFEFKINRIVRSDHQKYHFSARYRKNPRKIFITGFPRTDALIGKNKTQTCTNLLYAPTYIEKNTSTNFFEVFGEDTDYILNFLSENNIKLFVRFHPNNFRESKILITNLLNTNNIIDVSPDILEDVQNILPEIDVLITDFSSISQDFLILDRPIIFTTKDLNETSKISLVLREEFSFPGYRVNQPNQLYQAISEILDGKDKYAELRNFVRKLNYNFIDNKSCERVVKLLNKWNNL